MHEVAIACALFDAVNAQASRFPGERVVGVTLSIGGLQPLEPEAVRVCFALLAEGTQAEGADLIVERRPVTVFCGACGGERAADARFHCSACGGGQVRVIASPGMSVERISMRKEATTMERAA